MEKNILRIFGNLAAIQMKYNLQKNGNHFLQGFVLSLLNYGYWGLEVPVGDTRQVDRLELIARDCKAVGLDVEQSVGEMKDGSWSHSGSNYVDCIKLKVSLPVSPALEVLYAKSNKG